MRIISGRLKGRVLRNDPHLPVRPTTDFARTGLFNILNNLCYFDEIKFLDLFAGTGAIGLEAWSRGCEDVTMVDQEGKCIKYIDQHLTGFGIKGIRLHKAEVKSFCHISRLQYDVIFADPPYESPFLQEIPDWIFGNQLLEKEGIFILEHSESHDFSSHPHFSYMRKYGSVRFSFFEHTVDAA